MAHVRATYKDGGKWRLFPWPSPWWGFLEGMNIRDIDTQRDGRQ